MSNKKYSPRNPLPKVALFLPYSGIWNSQAANLNLVKTLDQAGFETMVVGCNKILNNYCGAMAEAGLILDSPQEDREFVCSNCRRRAALFGIAEAPKFTSLDNYSDDQDWLVARNLIEEVSRDNWRSFEVNGVNVGSLAGYEFFVNNKLTSLDIPSDLFQDYKQQMETSLRVQFAWSRFMEETQPEIVIVENEMYSYNRIVGMVSRIFGSRAYSVNHGIDIAELGNSITIMDDPGLWIDLNKDPAWISSKDSITPGALRQVRRHIQELTQGSSPWVYSKAFKPMSEVAIRRALAISPDAVRIIVAITSSLDEPIASDLAKVRNNPVSWAENSMFANQLEWLQFLISYAREHDDTHLVIRVHPRLLPNKRDSVTSAFAKKLSELIDALPTNVTMDWPNNHLALWNTLSIADIVANFSSTAGLEALLLGKPVIQHEPRILHSYPHQLNITPKSRKEYASLLSGAIDFDPSKSIIAVHQWLAWKFTIFARNVDNGIPSRRSWTLLRAVNGLYLRKKFKFLQKVMVGLEFVEIRKTKVDSNLAKDLRLVLVDNLRSLADVSRPINRLDWNWERDLIHEHADFLHDKFRRRIGHIALLVEKLRSFE